MDKRVYEVALQLFASELNKRYPEFKTIKGTQRNFPGAPIFEWKQDSKRKIWLVFGRGEREYELGLFCGWTTEGASYPKVTYCWAGDKPLPNSGVTNALLEHQFSDDVVAYNGKETRVEIMPPSDKLVAVATSNYFESVQYQEWLDRTVKWEARRREPPTREEIHAETLRGERALMVLWSHLLDRYPEGNVLLESSVYPAIIQIFNIIDIKTLPFLLNRLKSG